MSDPYELEAQASGSLRKTTRLRVELVTRSK